MSARTIARIKRLYEEATRATIEQDLIEAVTLLKTLPDEVSRERAAVYMDGLSQLRSEWRLEAQRDARRKKRPRRSRR